MSDELKKDIHEVIDKIAEAAHAAAKAVKAVTPMLKAAWEFVKPKKDK